VEILKQAEENEFRFPIVEPFCERRGEKGWGSLKIGGGHHVTGVKDLRVQFPMKCVLCQRCNIKKETGIEGDNSLLKASL
jgi:hypothetical protein